MKNLALTIAAVALLLTNAANAEEKGEVIRVLVPGMSCVGCSSSVTSSLKELKGVTNAYVNLKHKVALVDANTKVDKETITKAVKEAGYKATKVERLKLSWKEAKKSARREIFLNLQG